MNRSLLLLAALAATGCSSLSKPDERRVYKEPPQALVETPPAAPALPTPAADAPGMALPQIPQRPPGSGG